MRRTLTILAVALLTLALGASAAFADGGQTTTPTAKQKAGITKAWNGGKAMPASKQKCVTVAISKSNPVWAGLSFNDKATGCGAMAFDGSAILWGTGSTWSIFTEDSSATPAMCTAMASAIGASAWVDLAGYANGLGCQNID